MQIGVLGGTFNPPHIGHLRLAEEAASQLGLDRVLLVLSAIPPHKEASEILPVESRWKMLTLACEGSERLVPSDIEVNRTGPSFTIDTLRQIKSGLDQGDELHLIIGMDCWDEIETWKSYDEILRDFRLVVANRGDHYLRDGVGEVDSGIKIIDIPQLDISSSQIREALRNNSSVRFLVPDPVLEWIKQNGLYQAEASQEMNRKAVV